MLQPIWGRLSAVLGDRPTVLAIQTRHHAQHQARRVTQRLVAGKPRRDPIDHRAKLNPPPIRVYAVSHGDRGNFRCLHKPRTMPRSPPLPAQTRHTTKITIYGCSTNGASPQPDEACRWSPVSWGLRPVG